MTLLQTHTHTISNMANWDILHTFEINHRCTFILTSRLGHGFALFKLLTCIFLNCRNKDNFVLSTIECRSGLMGQGQRFLYIYLNLEYISTLISWFSSLTCPWWAFKQQLYTFSFNAKNIARGQFWGQSACIYRWIREMKDMEYVPSI